MSGMRALSLMLHLGPTGVVLHADVDREAALRVTSIPQPKVEDSLDAVDFLQLVDDVDQK
ncbi:hypothetical protein Pmar_PMAR011387, partial [Perkinsus marinus ATCC 50983]